MTKRKLPGENERDEVGGMEETIQFVQWTYLYVEYASENIDLMRLALAFEDAGNFRPGFWTCAVVVVPANATAKRILRLMYIFREYVREGEAGSGGRYIC